MRWLPLLLLVGCSMAADEVPTAEVAAAERAWLAQGLPLTERCESERVMLKKLVVHQELLAELCHVELEVAEGCYTVVLAGNDFVAAPLLVIDERYDRPWLDMHEMGHWLGDCSGLGSDAKHKNERIWGKRGMVEMAAKDLQQ